MSRKNNDNCLHSAKTKQFEIHVKEHLIPHWSEWFEGLTVTYTASGETILAGDIPDQSALHGLLARIRDLNLTLISVRQVLPKQPSWEKSGKRSRRRSLKEKAK